VESPRNVRGSSAELPSGASADGVRTTNQPYQPTVPTNRVRGLATQVQRAARAVPWSGQDGAIAWAEHSREYAREAGIAGRRFATFMDRLPLPALWYAIAEAAAEGHHAAGSLREDYLRSRCARIGEGLREIEKCDERAVQPMRGLRKLGVDGFLAQLQVAP